MGARVDRPSTSCWRARAFCPAGCKLSLRGRYGMGEASRPQDTFPNITARPYITQLVGPIGPLWFLAFRISGTCSCLVPTSPKAW